MTGAPKVPAARVDTGLELLDELRSVLTTYVVLPTDKATDAVALWIAATHALPAFAHAPRLAIASPTKQCGKSRLLDIVAGTCHRPLMSVNATVAAIFRSIGDEHPPTLLVDEADTIFGSKKVAENNEDFRALLNAGHQRGRPALRCVGPQQTPTEFPTFAMAALAGIGNLPDTITDRSINVTMRRRRPDEKVSQFRQRRDGAVLEDLRDRLAEWGQRSLPALAGAEPEMPVEDRAADTWEPLVAVADLVGGTWPERARAAAVSLTTQAKEEDLEREQATKLLSDVRDVFAEMTVSFLPSQELLNRLRKIEDAPWDDFGFTTRSLADRLRQFGVRPGHNTTKTARGYRLEDLADAFARYLRPEASEASDTPSDLREPPDASRTPDGSIRPPSATRPDETAGQRANGHLRTVSDDPADDPWRQDGPAWGGGAA